MGALGYNLKKMDHPDSRQRAELLATSFSSLTPGMIKKEVELIRELRPALSKYVWHTSLNFSVEELADKLTNENMLEMALEYMKAMGYEDNQYLIVRHHDADHPHVHLLVNRITYDGKVVSDSNNFHKSQAALRRLEKQYNLITLDRGNLVTKQRNNNRSLEQSSHITTDQPNNRSKHLGNNRSIEQRNDVTNGKPQLASQRSLTKNEIEKSLRTGQPSDKSVLQALLNPLVGTHGVPLQRFIEECEKRDIYLLFNQASTGRVSGITYFINDFMIKGQALGNRFKWAELIKYLDYEQNRDGQAISLSNDRTKARYRETQSSAGNERGSDGLPENLAPGTSTIPGQPTSLSGSEEEAIGLRADYTKTNENHLDTGRTDSAMDFDHHPSGGIQISDDIDDEAMLGRNRRKQKQARTNRR
ncbi:relaxase/mobilization nuclease domain-containing protein [Mucilaginibacter glaciei]|nr:relaxase/mobilization nuclease domain-containing protein [Mucilaginibacter glaciei]